MIFKFYPILIINKPIGTRFTVVTKNIGDIMCITDQYSEFACKQFCPKRFGWRVKVYESFPLSCCLVLFVQRHRTAHVELPSEQETHGGRPAHGPKLPFQPYPVYDLYEILCCLKSKDKLITQAYYESFILLYTSVCI